MPTRAVFHCQFCDAVPDHGTQRSLAGQVSERMFGEYLDAFPGRWLVWNGGGPLGPRRYACREHRGDLVAYLRYHYATVAAQVWKMPPYQARWPDEKRPHMGGSMGIIKFGLRGGLLQDRRPAGPPEPEAPGMPAAPEPPTAPPSPVASEPPADPQASGPLPGEPPPAAEDPRPEPAGEDEDAPHAPGEPPAEEMFAAGEAAAEDMFPPGELLVPDWDTEEPLFPPGQLFLPTDGPFAPGGGSGSGSEDSLEPDGPWPPEDRPSDVGGHWPDPPDSPDPPPDPPDAHPA